MSSVGICGSEFIDEPEAVARRIQKMRDLHMDLVRKFGEALTPNRETGIPFTDDDSIEDDLFGSGRPAI
jgi:hypothetical protein